MLKKCNYNSEHLAHYAQVELYNYNNYYGGPEVHSFWSSTQS